MVSYEAALLPATYETVAQDRAMWAAQRTALTRDLSTGRYRVHYVTMASQETEDLRNLLMSAEIAGVEVKVCLENV